MARKPKGRTRYVVKQEKQGAAKAATAKLAAGLQAREEKERKKKLSDPTYVKKMSDLEDKITEKRAIIDKRTQEIMAKTAPRLVKAYVNTHDWSWALKSAEVPVEVSVQFIQVLRRNNVNTLDKFKALPINNFAKHTITDVDEMGALGLQLGGEDKENEVGFFEDVTGHDLINQ